VRRIAPLPIIGQNSVNSTLSRWMINGIGMAASRGNRWWQMSGIQK
jgi:hypothetical protein